MQARSWKDRRFIPAGTLISFVAKDAMLLTLVQGRVWLTMDGELEDFWIREGEALDLPAGRLIVAEAYRADSIVEIVPVDVGERRGPQPADRRMRAESVCAP